MTTYTFGLRCNMTQKPMIVLTGPTAVGKTALSIELAKKINGAIISADSMQVYKYMDIGSAKVTVDEMDGIKHYLIDELEPSDEFNVFIFKLSAAPAFISRHFCMTLISQSRMWMRHTEKAFTTLLTSTETTHCMKSLRISTLHPTRASMRIT